MQGQCFRCGGWKDVKLYNGSQFKAVSALGLVTFLCAFCTRKVKKQK